MFHSKCVSLVDNVWLCLALWFSRSLFFFSLEKADLVDVTEMFGLSSITIFYVMLSVLLCIKSFTLLFT